MKHARPDYDRFQDPAGLIPADEPVFLLRGQDFLAHMAVRHYAFMAQQAGSHEIAAAAGEHAELMMMWAKKLPDMPPVATADETAAEERAARWNLDGRFVYRNKHGAVGYVDGPDSNPGLIAVIKVGGADAEQVAARLHAELSKPAVDTDALQADLRELLSILGMGDHARAASPHEVFQEALAVLRGRPLAKIAEPAAVRYQYREIGEGDPWRDCSKEVYDNFASHPTMDTREVPAASSGVHGDPASAIAAEIMGLGWALPEFIGDMADEEEQQDRRHGQVQTIVESVLARYGVPVAAPADPGELTRLAGVFETAAAKAPPASATTYRRLAAVLREPGFAGSAAAAPTIRCGDIVRHKPSNETWTVAYADPVSNNIAWCGWPDGIARLSDCEIVSAATDEQHRGTLREVIKAGGTRAAAAQRLYGDLDRVAHEAATPDDEFGAHILTESLGRIGDREIGPGHVVLSESRYEWLMARAALAKGGPHG